MNKIILTLLILVLNTPVAHSITRPDKLQGSWYNDSHSVALIKSSNDRAYYSWFFIDNNRTEHHFNGQLYFIPGINAYCGPVYKGNTLITSVIKWEDPIGSICFDIIDGILVSGYSTTHEKLPYEQDMFLFFKGDPHSPFKQLYSGSKVLSNEN